MASEPMVTVHASWMQMIVFLFAAFFIGLIWFRRLPSAKTVAIGTVLASLLLVPLLFLGVIFFYMGVSKSPTPARPRNVTIDMSSNRGISFHEDSHVVELPRSPSESFQPIQIPIDDATPVVAVPEPAQPSKAKADIKSTDVKPAAEKPEGESPAKATTAKETATVAAAVRPTWVDAPAKFSNGIYRTKVTVGPFSTREECDRALSGELLKATNDYIDSFLGDGASHWVHLPPGYYLGDGRSRSIPMPDNYADNSRIFRDQWQEDMLASFGPMIRVHTLLEFNEDTRHDLERRWQIGRSQGRLGFAGLSAGLVLVLLSTVFGYLKIDTATRGYYTHRLQFVAVLAILATLGLGWKLACTLDPSGFGF